METWTCWWCEMKGQGTIDVRFLHWGPWISLSLALFTKRRRVIAAAAVHQFSAVGCLHRVKHLRFKGEPLCNSHRKTALQLLKRRDSSRHGDDVFKVFFRCPPFNLNTRISYNHMDAVLMSHDWYPESSNILESDEVKFFIPNYIIT